MNKPTTFVLTAAILLTAIMSVTLYTLKAANAQSNMSTAGKAMVVGKAMNNTGGANMTKGNMTGAAMGAAKNMTGAAMGAAKNTTGK
ncbi:MAG: hypothetical protein WAZ77_22070 [Candidatus Nitrosopolaris sp.]